MLKFLLLKMNYITNHIA